jgi:hypothetical protein
MENPGLGECQVWTIPHLRDRTCRGFTGTQDLRIAKCGRGAGQLVLFYALDQQVISMSGILQHKDASAALP